MINHSQKHQWAKFFPLLALISLTVIWGGNWIVSKIATKDCAPFIFSAMRTDFGTPFLFLGLVLCRKSLAPPPLLPVIMIALLQVTAFVGLSQWALVAGGAGKTAMLVFTMPFWVVLFALFLLGERPRPLQWMAILLAAAGLVFIFEPWKQNGTLFSEILAVAAGFFWGLAVVIAKRLYRRPGIDVMSLVAWQTLIGGVALTVIAWAVPSRPTVWTPGLIGAVIYNAIMVTSIGWFFWMFVLKKLPANITSLSSLAIPVLGIFLAWWILGERPDWAEGIGIAIIVSALVMITRFSAESGETDD